MGCNNLKHLLDVLEGFEIIGLDGYNEFIAKIVSCADRALKAEVEGDPTSPQLILMDSVEVF